MTEPADPLERSPIDRTGLVLLVAAIAMLAVDAWVLATTAFLAPWSAVVREALFIAAWLGVGAVALVIRRGLMARRILAFALVLAADVVGSFGLLGHDVLPRLLITATAVLVPLQTAFAGHLLVAYPTGRIPDRLGRRLVVTAYVLGGIQSTWWAFGHVSRRACAECARSFTLWGLPEPVDDVAARVFLAAWGVLAVALAVLLVSRYRRAGARERRLLRLPYLATLAAAALYAAMSAIAGIQGAASVWLASAELLVALQAVVVLGVPFCFLLGLLRERLSYRGIGELVVQLAGSGDADLEHSLAVALGDPQLSVAFAVDGGFVDSHGRALPRPQPDERTTVTEVGEHGAPMALIRHDRSLDEEPALLTAAGSATRLMLENACLQAEVRAQLQEVRESRTRIVTAADAARARLERDLHDGAQQRLLAIGLALRMLREQPGDAALLDAAETELASALAEMRELAAGIHPAVLTDLGLVAALDALAARLGARVRLDVPGPVPRYPPEIEAAAYFSASEAIANAVKHAAPASVDVSVVDTGDRVAIRVTDDGPGGADPAGTGLLGIRDRLASVDGILTIVSRPGGGTDLTLELPCA